MASRRDRHHAHKAALQALGKGLSRRARSRCELCEAAGERLQVTEVTGSPEEEPGEDWALLLCDRCRELTDKGPDRDLDTLRFLTTAMWSEVQPVQVAAVRLLRRLDVPWATEGLDGLWLDEEQEARIRG